MTSWAQLLTNATTYCFAFRGFCLFWIFLSLMLTNNASASMRLSRFKGHSTPENTSRERGAGGQRLNGSSVFSANIRVHFALWTASKGYTGIDSRDIRPAGPRRRPWG